MAKAKKIKKSIENLEKRKKEHEDKMAQYEKQGGKNYALLEYWEKEIERFDDEIEKQKEKIN